MKGQISLIESIISAVVLFIAFNMIITIGDYQTKWKESLNSLEGKDILITADRLGRLHDYSFSPTDFNSQFLSRIDAIKDAIIKVETQGTVKNTLYIACDCTSEQITYLNNILSDVKFNLRTVNVDICSTTLPTINPCTSTQSYPDLLIIWGYKNLVPYIETLTDLKNNGVGIIEIADVQQDQVDTAQRDIFGLKWFTDNPFPPITQDEFLKPRNTLVIPYQSYKWFYHLPYLLNAPTEVSPPLPVESPPPPGCTAIRQGEFKFQDTSYKFWICDDPVNPSVYFDTNGNNQADLGPIIKGQKFSIGISNFKLNYIDGINKIRISFKPNYIFDDFVINDDYNKLFPLDDDKNKVLLSMGFWDLTKEQPIGAVILGGTENAKTIWMADFARNGLTTTGDDHKQLIASLILSLSNRYTKETFQIGQITSYINVNNTDILEIYKIDLSIGRPF